MRSDGTGRLVTGPVETVTVLVGDVDAAVRLYDRGVGLQPGPGESPSAALERQLPILDRCRSVTLVPPGDDRQGRLRLVEVPGIRPPHTLATIGWAAAELIVADADAAAQRARSAGLQVLADPAPVGVGGGLRAAQIRGPAGEALYLTQVDQAPPGFDLPQPVAAVGRVFIAVLAARDLDAARARLERTLGARRVTDHALAVRALNACMGLPEGTRHRVSTVQLAGSAALEIDQYPPTAHGRQGMASPTGGIVCVTITGRGSPTVQAIPGTDGALLEISGPATADTGPCRGR